MSKPVWQHPVERDAWVEKNCRVCFQADEARKRVTGTGPGCPHLARGDENKMPKPWTRRRNAVWGETYRCAEFLDQPPVNRRTVSVEETPPMFDDIEAVDRNLVPVEGWPDWKAEERARKSKDNHA
jgi:putative SOS response-associated peptidase YedK